ncbi:MAG: quinohemoprotein amine dehydrogenase maturase, partial [Alphaproteobacteria bacterium]|nr:quinohemoprotein amine dehydrogenase maturase [Alphaproteobacteria bacterium]
MTGLHLVPENMHEVRLDGRQLLFHVPTTSLFEMDEVAGDVLGLFREKALEKAAVTADDVRDRFDGVHEPERLAETLNEFKDLQIVRDSGLEAPSPAPVKINDYPISTMVLNVNTGCNLSCTYCYKE